MAPSLYDWKIVDWDVKPQHNQPTNKFKSKNGASVLEELVLLNRSTIIMFEVNIINI